MHVTDSKVNRVISSRYFLKPYAEIASSTYVLYCRHRCWTPPLRFRSRMPELQDTSRIGTRTHRIPPAPTPLDRVDVLGELEDAPGLVLWRALTDARLWGESGPQERQQLFRKPNPRVRERFALACAEIPALAPAFSTFSLMQQSPGVLTSTQVADAYKLVRDWADERSLISIALLFAEAAAHAEPENPARANLAARTARRALMYDRAGDWHRRAHKLAVRAKDPGEVVWALIGYGAMLKKTDRVAEARRTLLHATRRARALGRRKEAGMAHHDLMNIAVETGRYRVAEVHAIEARSHYPDDHPRIPALAHDFAFALLRQGLYSSALMLLEHVVPLIARPEERALVLSTLAWSAAGAGRTHRFAEAERQALQLVGVYDDHTPSVFLHLAEGMRIAGDVEGADRYAEAAAAAAVERLDAGLEGEALQMRIGLREGVVQPRPVTVQPVPRTRIVVRDLAAALKRIRDVGP